MPVICACCLHRGSKIDNYRESRIQLFRTTGLMEGPLYADNDHMMPESVTTVRKLGEGSFRYRSVLCCYRSNCPVALAAFAQLKAFTHMLMYK